METESDKSALIKNDKNGYSNKWSKTQMIVLLICIICTGIITNLDRIIEELSSSNDNNNNKFENEYDIIIIGAGITGLTTSHLLSTSDSEYSTLTIERFNRVCGRTFSSNLKYNKSSIIFENAAMRFYYNSLHQKLLKRMDLCDHIIPLMDTAQNTYSSYYLYRNLKKKVNEINGTNYWQKIYNFDDRESEWIKNGFNPIMIGFDEILQENNNGIPPNTENEWNNFWNNWTLRGVFVRNWSYNAFMKHIVNISVEYDNYLIRNGFYSPANPPRDENVAQIFYNTFYVNNNSNINSMMYTLDNGYDAICHRLYDNSSQYEENNFLFGKNVIGIDYNYDRNKNKYKYIISVKDVYSDNMMEIYTNNVISTIAPSQFKHLLPYFQPINTKYTQYLMDSLVMRYRYKINLIFDSSFWINSNLTDLITSLASDETFSSFYIENAWTNGTLTTFHIFTLNGALFHRLQMLNDPYLFSDDIEIDNIDGLLVSSTFLVKEVVKQLRRFTNKDIPMPIAAFSSPFGYNMSDNAGLYNWKYGYIPSEILENIFKPVNDENIFIASTDFSPFQSFQFGGIWAAIQNLERNFKINNSLQNDDECVL